jgi:hypothetical protein
VFVQDQIGQTSQWHNTEFKQTIGGELKSKQSKMQGKQTKKGCQVCAAVLVAALAVTINTSCSQKLLGPKELFASHQINSKSGWWNVQS